MRAPAARPAPATPYNPGSRHSARPLSYGFLPTALAPGPGAVYVGLWTDVVHGTGEVAAFDAATGARLWTTRLSAVPEQLAVTGTVVVGIMSSVAAFALDASNGVVYTSPGPLSARDARTSRYLWLKDGEADQPDQL